jgi:hypothetical protein
MNRTKGTVQFSAGEHSYTLAYTTNALCILESDLGDAIWTAFETPDKMRIGTMRTVFWAGLQEHHPNITKDAAGRLMDALGIPRVLELVMNAVTLAFPEAKQGDRPLAVANGSGIGTTS